MAEVNFYILATESVQERRLFACKLAEKAYRNGHYCYVMTESEQDADIIDDLLWTFRPGSFIPHKHYDGQLPEFSRIVLVGSKNPPPAYRKSVLNLSSQCPPDFEQAERILEILDDSEDTKASGRDRYRRYQQAGLAINTHKMAQ